MERRPLDLGESYFRRKGEEKKKKEKTNETKILTLLVAFKLAPRFINSCKMCVLPPEHA
jgi:hypothetical protein